MLVSGVCVCVCVCVLCVLIVVAAAPAPGAPPMYGQASVCLSVCLSV